MRFDDKVVVVTGSGSGFGAAIASRFAREGARVTVADVNEESGARIVATIAKEGGTARFARGDVSRSDDVKATIDGAVAAFGGLDVLVNNAGFSHRTMGLWDLPEEDYDRIRDEGRGHHLDARARGRGRAVSHPCDAVNPVAAETGFMKTALGTDKIPEEVRKQLVATVPLGRLAEPRDVAAAMTFLASDDAEFMTGGCLDVDGGRSIS